MTGRRATSRTNPLLMASRGLGAAQGVPTPDQRLALMDELLAPMIRHRSQRAVLEWVLTLLAWHSGEATRPVQNLAVLGPRRSGKSSIVMAIAALLVGLDGFVVRMLTNTLRAPTVNVLETPGTGGLLARLAALGLGPWLDIDRAAGSVISVGLPWGSTLEVHDIGNERAIKKHHGFTAALYWADEAQHIEWLHYAISNLVAPTLADNRGLILLTGTPGDQVGSLFHQLSTGRDSGYKAQRLATWHNPLFGDSPEARWRHICDTSIAMARAQYSVTEADFQRLRALTEAELDAIATESATGDLHAWVQTLDAELRRQLFGLWVSDAAAHVFAWHHVSAAELYYCAVPGHPDAGLPNAATVLERVELLPRFDHDGTPLRNTWRAAIAIDLGSSPDPCALLLLAWSPNWPIAYEVWSEKWWKLLDSEMLAKLQWGVDAARDAGLLVGTAIADAAGMREGTRGEWDRSLIQRYQGLGIGVRAPYKPANYKAQRTRAINIDIAQGRLRFVAGGALDIEGQHLRYEHADPALGPAKVHKHRVVHLADGRSIMPGNDLLDCLLYGAEDVGHLLCDLNPATTAPPVGPVNARRDDFFNRQFGA